MCIPLDLPSTASDNPGPSDRPIVVRYRWLTTPEGAMAFVLVIVVAALLVGFVARGSLRNFERLSVRWWGIALAGLALQAVPIPERFGSRWAVGALVASYGLLIIFVVLNRRLPAAPLILIGLILNVLVIAANGGMPVSGSAIETAGARGEGLLSGIEGTKHHLMGPDDVLTPLADVIPIPPPAGVILSAGDLCIYAGVAAFVILVMLGRFQESPPPKARLQMYRGKHLPSSRRLPRRRAARLSALRVAGGPPGTGP
jgi:Family of unknown function (DUF5317)